VCRLMASLECWPGEMRAFPRQETQAHPNVKRRRGDAEVFPGNRERKVRPAYFASHAADGSSIGNNLARLRTSFAIVLGCGGKARHLRSRS
jgi:hypothetical protein